MITKPTIKHRCTGAVLFEGEAEMTTRQMLEKATAFGANLSGADLSGANLSRANLSRANLSGANLSGANLSRANLPGANLSGADLSGANLSGADLSGADLPGANLFGANLSGANLSRANLSCANLSRANLSGANLPGCKLVGKRPYFSIGPIGSRCATLTLWLTDKGPVVKAGCFTGSLDEFASASIAEHGENDHGKEYAAAVLVMQSHAALWTPEFTEVAP